jgi:DNA (cytosine-5)-methyltransferase 1
LQRRKQRKQRTLTLAVEENRRLLQKILVSNSYWEDEIIIDNFAGGGGASTGIELATGRSVNVAINHDPTAIAMHEANHPQTYHYCEDVWAVDPRKVMPGHRVGLVWLSPDCTHHSKARGGKPREKKIRGLAWVALRWAATRRPRVMILENVEEFQDWGPLDKNGKPIKAQKSRIFRVFVNALRKQGYEVEWRILKACDYGAPTTRKRLFLIARCDGLPIIWPEPTHGEPKSQEVRSGRLKPWRTAAEIIDWSLPCPSIFDTAEEIKEKYDIRTIRPLADNTMQRIAKGTQKFIIDNPSPFIARVNHSGSNHHYCNSIDEPLSTITSKNGWSVVAPILTQYHSYKGDGVRGQVVDKPLLTVDTNQRYALTTAFISKYYGTGEGSSLKDPLHTVTVKDRNALVEAHLCVLRNHMDCKNFKEPLPTIMTSPGHFAEVRTVLTKIGNNQNLGHWPEVREILNKYCGYNIIDDEILLFEINGDMYFISDIGMRMLTPRELYNAQGFPVTYIINPWFKGKQFPQAEQVAKCGNSVSPVIPNALVRSNLPEHCVPEFSDRFSWEQMLT